MRRLVPMLLALACVLPPGLPAQSRVRSREAERLIDRALSAPGATRRTGALTIAAGDRFAGPLVVQDGPLTIGGRVEGSVTAIDADVALLPGAVIDGDLVVIGGTVTGRDGARIEGELRILQEAAPRRARGEDDDPLRPRAVVTRDRQEDAEDAWVTKWRDAEWRQSGIRLTMARTYNRTEGWPIVFGPIHRTDFGWGRLALDAFGIFRTSQGTQWNTSTLGHRARAELRLGRNYGLTLGGRSYDIVDAVEPWQLSEGENGLSSFFLQRDLRDWYDRQGGQGYARLFAFDGAVTLGASYGQERWRSRGIHDVFALFNRPDGWRANPQVDDGVMHLTTAAWTIDTRNDADDPTSGWLMNADYEHGTGTLVLTSTTRGLRPVPSGAFGAAERTTYGRGFVDLRRYNRLAPDAELRFRIVAGGWLHGDPLPMQRRLSLSGPAGLPGFPFRAVGSAGSLECADGGAIPLGSPAQCDRIALAQVEYRGALHIDVFDGLGDAPAAPRRGLAPPGRGGQRYRGWSSRTRGSFVLFADAGRGWLVGAERPTDARFVREGRLPALPTFRSDIGAGLELGVLGLYLAKAVSAGDADVPPVVFVRVNRRF
ncbi:MAG: hypothetical protein ACK6DK_08640 [Gemmatimonadota bacterium]